jgi:hypothetical protein
MATGTLGCPYCLHSYGQHYYFDTVGKLQEHFISTHPMTSKWDAPTCDTCGVQCVNALELFAHIEREHTVLRRIGEYINRADIVRSSLLHAQSSEYRFRTPG